MGKNERGLALLTVLILSIIALMLIGALVYFLLKGKETQVLQSRYTSSLEAAKGASELVMKMIIDPFNTDLPFLCSDTESNAYNNQNCTADCSPTGKSYICLKTYKCLGSTDLSTCDKGYKITARLLALRKFTTGEEIYTIEIKSVYTNNPRENSVIQFVYKISEQ